jgi:cytochrome P450
VPQTDVRPAHVPAELVFDFDMFASPELAANPHESVARLLHGAPDLFFTPRNGGHWMVTRAADAVEILGDPQRFSSSPEYNEAGRRGGLRMIPNQYDPPEQVQYRAVLNPPLSPGGVKRIKSVIQDRAIALIEEVRPAGRCEFVGDVAKRFPIDIFLGMVAAPAEDRTYLIGLAETIVRDPNREVRDRALNALGDYVRGQAQGRRERPGDDLLTHIVQSRVGDRPITMDEVFAMGTLLFLAGLDTVASTLAFIMEALARNPDQYRRLIDDRSMIPAAVEELLRVRGNASMERAATHDFRYRDIEIRKHDRFVFLPALYGLDDRAVEDPFRIDFDRPASRHLTFGAGPHRCVGSHLARLEISVFLEAWIERIGDFQVDADGDLPTLGGIVWIHEKLPLKWSSR